MTPDNYPLMMWNRSAFDEPTATRILFIRGMRNGKRPQLQMTTMARNRNGIGNKTTDKLSGQKVSTSETGTTFLHCRFKSPVIFSIKVQGHRSYYET